MKILQFTWYNPKSLSITPALDVSDVFFCRGIKSLCYNPILITKLIYRLGLPKVTLV